MDACKTSKVIIITGSSRGIGAATAIEAAHQGYSVCINYHRNHQSAEKVAEQVASIGVPHTLIQADVSRANQVKALFETTRNTLGPITALVNNVGILKEKMPLMDMPTERIEQVIFTNIMSAIHCSREAIRTMARSRGGQGGSIVNVSSAASRLGAANEYVDYAASKGAMDSLTIGLAKEVAADGIRVNGVRPGFIKTAIHADGGEANRVARLAEKLPMQRGGEPEEIAKTIIWLCSDAASYVTGSFIDAAGGL